MVESLIRRIKPIIRRGHFFIRCDFFGAFDSCGASFFDVFPDTGSDTSQESNARLQSVGALHLADEWDVVAGELETRQFIVAAKRQGRLVGAVTYGMGRKLAPYRIKLTRPEQLEAVTQ